MELSLLQENLNSALQNVSRFVTSKSQLPILNNILLSTDQGRLKLSATNLEVGINYWIGAKIIQEGNITVPAKEITEFVSYLQPGKLDLKLDQNQLLSLTSPKSESTFTTIASTDFPVIPSIDSTSSFTIDPSLFHQSISQIAFSAAADDTRPILTSILCQFSVDKLFLVATDGFRLSCKTIKLTTPLKLKSDKNLPTLLIPSRSLVELTKLSRNAKSLTLGLTSDEHQIVFAQEDLELVSRLLEGEYPDYQRIIPDSYRLKVQLDRDEFSQAIKIASVFARESANVVKLNIKPSSLEITANAPQIGKNRVSVDAKVEGEPLEIAFNYKFISDFLSVSQGKNIALNLNESLTPGLFQDQSDPDFIHIIMPFRLQD